MNHHQGCRLSRTALALLFAIAVGQAAGREPENRRPAAGLVGHWKLQGDCRDASGNGRHGINHGVDLATGDFDGRSAWIEVPAGDALRLGTGDFTVAAWVHTAEIVDDTLGDVVGLFDPRRRRGFTLNMKASSGGYQSSGDDRHVTFGIDDAVDGAWEDCGRPNPTSNYVSNCLTVFDGDLYAATIDARDEADWCHVYRYAGGRKWIDCGRVGTGKTTGVMALIVHRGHLYAGTCTYDWTRVFSGNYDPCHVYRYAGGTTWEDCGQIGQTLRMGTLYVVRAGFCCGLLVQGPGCLSVLQWPPDGTDSCASRGPRHSPGARAAVGDLRAEAIALLPR